MIYLIPILGLAVALLLLFWQISSIVSIALGAPAISSPHHSLLKRFGGKDKTLVDLGCGIGSVCLAASKDFSHVYGIEYSPFYYIVAKWRTRKHKNVTILFGNILTTPWPKSSYLYSYLLPGILAKLKPRFRKEKTALLSLAFQVPGEKADRVIEEDHQKLYIYHY